MKMVDSVLYVFFFYISLLPIKTDSFINYFLARNNIQLRFHICCTPDPQQSLRLFIGPVATSLLRERFVPGVLTVATPPRNPIESYSVGGLVNPDSIQIAFFCVRSAYAIN